MNIRFLTASAMSLTLLAAALPGAALAKDAAQSASETPAFTGVVVVAQDSGADKPKVEGWQTGEGDMSEGDCETLANNISQYLDWASIDLESGDMDQAFHDISRAEEMEGQALDGGCALSYPT